MTSPGFAAIALVLGSVACSGALTTESEARLIPACTWPDTGAACVPRSMFQICEVPSGSTVRADGTVITPDGGAVSCEDACTPSEYSLTCTDSTPAASLGCKSIPIPTPRDILFYCCPCAP